MRTIIAGSRTINDSQLVEAAIDRSGFDITTVISGTAGGVDKLGELWALDNQVPILFFPANWREHGKKAGFIRNSEMADHADGLIAVWDGKSKGTKMMIDIARGRELEVFIVETNGNNDRIEMSAAKLSLR
jgi:YspA, cpYpsA-related SLOG family